MNNVQKKLIFKNNDIIYVVINAITQTVTTFTSQNIGAKKPERLSGVFKNGLLISMSMSFILSVVSYLAKDLIIEVFAPGDAVVKEFAVVKFQYVILPYFTVAFMEMPTGMLRGMNKTFISMVMCILGVCGFRILWLLLILPMQNTLQCVYVSYPISWVATGVINTTACLIAKKKLSKVISSGKSSFAL